MWKVYDKTGQTVRCEIQKLEYNGTWMGECFVSATINSPIPIDFSIGDYLEYRNERFEINYDPSALKKNAIRTYGESFVYDSVKFNNLADELTRCDFLDYVKNDNNIHFTSLPKFSFYASSVQDLADRIQVNLDRIYTGDKRWTVEVHPEYVSKTDVNISVDNIKVWDALGLVNSQFKANFIIRGRVVTIGTAGIAVDNVFMYGKGKGLYEIQRTAESDQQIITRLRAYGSTRNLPNRYYNKLSGDRGNYLPDNMAVMNLMLPGFPETTLDPYLDSDNIGEIEVREGTVFFDGSDEEHPEIYPSMEGMTAEDLKEAGIPVQAEGNLDEVVSAEQISDNGQPDDENKIEKGTFTITLKDIGFDINDYLTASTATISMKSGACGGREFEIVECKNSGNNYVLTCNRTQDSSLNLYFPYKDYNIQPGDKFVLLNIDMPDVYIKAASQRLLEVSKEYLSKNDYVRYSYEPKVDDIYMARQHDEAVATGGTSIHDTIKEGDIFLFNDTDLGIDGSITIDSLTIKEGDGIIPKYDIVLREEKVVGTIQKIQNQIDSIAGGQGSGGYTAQQIRSLIKAYGELLFLSKTKPDTTNFLLNLLGGAVFGKDGFASGPAGFGAKIGEKGDAEVESLISRRFIETPEFRYNRVDIEVGDKWRAPGAGIIESVDTENRICTLKLEEGEIGAVAAGDICMGIFHSLTPSDNATEDTDDGLGNRTFAGFCTVYFTITEVIGERNEQFKYQIRPVSERWKYSFAPFEQMNFVSYGNFTDEERQTSVYETRTYTRMLWKQNTWEIGKGNVAMQQGDLTNLNIFGMQMAGYSMYLNSVYFTGTITQIKPDGTPVRTANERGAWEAGHYDFFDRVSHDGCIWLCLAEDGTDTEPVDGNSDWLKQVDKGDTGATGATGAPGKDGKGVSSVDVLYYLSTSATSLAGGSWSTTAPAWVDGKYIWSKTKVVYTDGSSKESNPACITGSKGATGNTGATGAPGKGVKSIVEQYYQSTSNTAQTGGSWANTPPAWVNGKYIWTRSVITYTDNSSTTTTPVCVTGGKGDTGATGATGAPGKDGKGVTNCGEWHDGLSVPILGLVTMGGKAFLAKKATGNPPMWTLTDNSGNRLKTEQGYILTGEVNDADYDIVVENGKNGLSGCSVRESEWAEGVEYRNDTDVPDGMLEARYLDIVLVRNDATETGWDAYQCLKTHVSSGSITYANASYWSKFGVNVGAIFTSLIIAKNAKIKFLQGNQLLIQKSDGSVTAGVSGSDSGGKIRFWAGSATPDNAPFRVNEFGKLVATDADIAGRVTATSGKIGGFEITSSSIGTKDKGLGIYQDYIYVGNSHRYASIGYGLADTGTIGRLDIGARICTDRTPELETGGNVGVYISMEGAKSYDNSMDSGNHALYIPNGHIQGFRLRARRVTSSENISLMDSIIFCLNSSEITLTLPNDAEDGQIYYIRKCGTGNVRVKGRHIVDWGSSGTTSFLLDYGRLAILMFDGSRNFWTCNIIERAY